MIDPSVPALDLAAELDLAVRAAREAGEIAMRFFGRDTPVSFKSADQPVTEADLRVDRRLHEMLLSDRPGYGWLSEETADSVDRLAAERVWIVDPIDGTRSFVDGHPEFAISIGLVVGGVAAVGVVFNPATAEMYHAVRGGGACVNGRPLRVAPTAPSSGALVASRTEIARGQFQALAAEWRIVPLGSTAYKMVKTADGTAAGYVSRGPKSEWDVCAAALIVAEAGGTVTDLGGSTLQFNRPEPFLRGIVAGTTTAHARLLAHAATVAAREVGRRKEV